MAKHRSTSSDEPPYREGVAVNLGRAYWSVDDCRWPTVRPNLPEYMVDLLALPIVVGAAPVALAAGAAGPAAVGTAPVVVTSRLTAPGGTRPGPGGSHASGRHRRPAG